MAGIKRLIVDFLDKVFKDDLFTQAAALSFYTAISIAPLLILFLFLLSPLGLEDELLVQTQGLLGKEASTALHTVITSTTAEDSMARKYSAIGFAALLISASAVFAQLQSSLNIIFGSTFSPLPNEPWMTQIFHVLVRRLISFGMVLTFIFISVVSLAISSVLTLLSFGHVEGAWQILHLSVHFVVFALLFTALFKWMPDKRVPTRSAIRGGLVTSALFVIGKTIIGAYLAQAALGSSFVAGPLIALLVWVYYSSIIVFVGAEVCVLIITEKEAAAFEELA